LLHLRQLRHLAEVSETSGGMLPSNSLRRSASGLPLQSSRPRRRCRLEEFPLCGPNAGRLATVDDACSSGAEPLSILENASSRKSPISCYAAPQNTRGLRGPDLPVVSCSSSVPTLKPPIPGCVEPTPWGASSIPSCAAWVGSPELLRYPPPAPGR
jgi:hypothetical protein